MWINVIDYRGDNTTIINKQGQTIFAARTDIFLKQQADFAIWKAAGHKFRCFTQHSGNPEHYAEFDDVIEIPRGNASQSRNHVLAYYPQGTWIAIWDNDATLYFDRLASRQFIRDLDSIVIPQADAQGLTGFIPYNPQQAPYPKPSVPYTFKCKIEQKTTMIWLKVGDYRYNETLTILEDWELAYRLAQQGHIFAQSQDVSLKEYALALSTIFDNRKDEGKYEERKRQYAIAREQLEQLFGCPLSVIKEQHKINYAKSKTKDTFTTLFEEVIA